MLGEGNMVRWLRDCTQVPKVRVGVMAFLFYLPQCVYDLSLCINTLNIRQNTYI